MSIDAADLLHQRGLRVTAQRLMPVGKTLSYIRYIDDFPVFPLANIWDDTVVSGFGEQKEYVVQNDAENCRPLPRHVVRSG